LTGSAHDASAFEHTAAVKHSNWFFDGDEFAWMDSAYPVTLRSIPVHKRPASLRPENTTFDHLVSHLRVRSEHCMGALKGRWQCLRGLRTVINSKRQHKEACRWMTIAIILHNIVIEVEGGMRGAYFSPIHTRYEEEDDRGLADLAMEENDEDGGEQKRRMLVEELIAFREMEQVY
jgi:DDE superfamily endonuclease